MPPKDPTLSSSLPFPVFEFLGPFFFSLVRPSRGQADSASAESASNLPQICSPDPATWPKHRAQAVLSPISSPAAPHGPLLLAQALARCPWAEWRRASSGRAWW